MEQSTDIDFESFVATSEQPSTFDAKKFLEEERMKAWQENAKEQERLLAEKNDTDIKEKVFESNSPENVKKMETTIEFEDFQVPTKIEIKKSSLHGHGVFAKSDIVEGELVEEARMFRLSWRQAYHRDPVLSRYIFADASCKCRDCQVHGPSLYMGMGYVGLYNYGFDSNIRAEFDYINLKVKLIASENIPAGKEITFDDSAFKPNGDITTTEAIQ